MPEKVVYTSVLVSDQEKALDTYANVLGPRSGPRTPRPTAERSEDRRWSVSTGIGASRRISADPEAPPGRCQAGEHGTSRTASPAAETPMAVVGDLPHGHGACSPGICLLVWRPHRRKGALDYRAIDEAPQWRVWRKAARPPQHLGCSTGRDPTVGQYRAPRSGTGSATGKSPVSMCWRSSTRRPPPFARASGKVWQAGHPETTRAVFDEVTLADNLPTFLTLPAYDRLD